MVFTHADPAPPPVVEHAIAVAPPPSLLSPVCGGGKGDGRRQGLGVGLAVALPVQALVGKVRKDAHPAGHEPRRAAIFMDARTGIEAGRRNIRRNAVRTGAHDHVAALLPRPPFEPVDVIPVDANVRQRGGLGHDEVRRDRRFPGAVSRALSCGHSRPKFQIVIARKSGRSSNHITSMCARPVPVAILRDGRPSFDKLRRAASSG